MTGAWNKASRLGCTDLPVTEVISTWEPASHSRSRWTSMAPNAQFREASNQSPFIVKQLSYLLTHIMYHSNCRVVFCVGGDILLTDGIIPSVSKIAPPISLWNDFSPRPLNSLLMIRHIKNHWLYAVTRICIIDKCCKTLHWSYLWVTPSKPFHFIFFNSNKYRSSLFFPEKVHGECIVPYQYFRDTSVGFAHCNQKHIFPIPSGC